MELTEAIKGRRSVRKFTEDTVTDNQIKEMLEAAKMAPSWANTQCWEFVVVRDKSVIEKIVSAYSETNPARKCSLASSVLIVVCAKVKASGYKKGEKSTQFAEWFMFDCGCAVQNLCLKGQELGVGTVIVGSMDHSSIKKTVQLPDEYEPVVVIPCGIPMVKGKDGPPRRSVEEISHLNNFGNTY